MKKILGFLFCAMLVFGFAGQSMAYFEDLHLIRTILDTTSPVEVGSDLGLDVSTFSLSSPVNEVRLPTADLSLFVGGLESLTVGYWAHDIANKDFYVTGYMPGYMGDADGLVMNGRKQVNGDTVMNTVQGYYAGSGTDTMVGQQTVSGPDYFSMFSKGGTADGSFGGSLASGYWEVDISLADLQTEGYIDQYLYYFDYDNSAGAKAGVEVAVLRTFLTSDGTTIDLAGNQISTVVNPAAVPVPASLLLLGSGLLGLFGIRRKNG